MALPDYFCWTRFGTEAGQTIEHILARKEQERVRNGGMFFWGIGNAIGAGLRELLRRSSRPEVLFSPIKSRPRIEDAFPSALAAWVLGETLDGGPFSLPPGSIVTSRYSKAAPRQFHFALVCHSQTPLSMSQSGDTIDFGELRNLVSGRPMGASQVTAVVKRDPLGGPRTGLYDIALRVELVYPYLVRLQHPLEVPKVGQSASDECDWETAVRRFIDSWVADRGLEAMTPWQPRLWEQHAIPPQRTRGKRRLRRGESFDPTDPL